MAWDDGNEEDGRKRPLHSGPGAGGTASSSGNTGFSKRKVSKELHI